MAAIERMWMRRTGRGRPAVLVACGSFSPVTYLHLRLFEVARDYLRREGTWEVVGGVMSPVHDAYGKRDLLPGAHRVAMCRLAVQSSDWITVSDWEVRQAEWTRTRPALEHFERVVNAEQPPVRVQVMMLSGSDLVESFLKPGLWSDDDVTAIAGKLGLVSVERFGVSSADVVAANRLLGPFQGKSLHLVPQPVLNDVSSTKMRELIRSDQSIRYLINDEVVDYIHAHRLYKPDQSPPPPL